MLSYENSFQFRLLCVANFICVSVYSNRIQEVDWASCHLVYLVLLIQPVVEERVHHQGEGVLLVAVEAEEGDEVLRETHH